MIHIDSVSKSVKADLTLLQKDKPNDFAALKNMGVARKWSITINPFHKNFRLSSVNDLTPCLFDFCDFHNLKGCMSPLHNADFLANGDTEEPHYHFYTVSKAPRTSENIASLSYYLNGFLPPVKRVENELGYFRYFTHQDDLDKAQYSPEDIICFNGYVPPASGNVSTQSATQELLDLSKRFDNIYILTSYVLDHRPDLANVLLRFSNVLKTYYTGRLRGFNSFDEFF